MNDLAVLVVLEWIRRGEWINDEELRKQYYNMLPYLVDEFLKCYNEKISEVEE